MVNHPRNNRARHRSNRSLIRDRDRTLMNKDKVGDKDGSFEVKEVVATEVKSEESTKIKEEEKPKEVVEAPKALRDCRKEAPRSRSKEDKPEKKDEKVTAKEHPSRKAETEIVITGKTKESKVDEREDRAKVRESVKSNEAVSSSTKVEGRPEKECLRSRKDKDAPHKEPAEKDVPKVNKVNKKDSRELKEKQEEKEEAKLPNKKERDSLNSIGGRVGKKVTLESESKNVSNPLVTAGENSNSVSTSGNSVVENVNSGKSNAKEPVLNSDLNNVKVKKRSIFSKVAATYKTKNPSPDKSKIKKVSSGICTTRQKKSFKDHMKAIVKKLKLKSNNTNSNSTTVNDNKETKNIKDKDVVVKPKVTVTNNPLLPPTPVQTSIAATTASSVTSSLRLKSKDEKKRAPGNSALVNVNTVTVSSNQKKGTCANVEATDDIPENHDNSTENNAIVQLDDGDTGDKNIQLTRSKSKEEVIGKPKKIEPPAEPKKSTNVPLAVSTGSSTSPSQPPQGNPPSETEKKRGRKRKDDEKGSSNEEVLDLLPSYKSVSVGDKLKVYYGPTHESKVTYEAKVLNLKEEGSETTYLVHYTGWNTRYDEWIKRSRIADNLSWTPGRVKRNRLQQQSHTQLQQQMPPQQVQPTKPGQQPPTIVATKRGRSGTTGDNGASSVSSTSSVNSTTTVVKRATTPLSASRTPPHATRTYSRARQRTRHISGHTDFSESESDVEYESDSDMETSSSSLQKRNDRLNNSGDEKEDVQYMTKGRRRTNSLQISNSEDKAKEDFCPAGTGKRRSIATSYTTSEDERDGKKLPPTRMADDKLRQNESRMKMRNSVEKEIKSSDELSQSSDRLRGRKLRSDKVNTLTDSEDETNDVHEEVTIKRDMRRPLSDRRRNNDVRPPTCKLEPKEKMDIDENIITVNDDDDDSDNDMNKDDVEEVTKPLEKIQQQKDSTLPIKLEERNLDHLTSNDNTQSKLRNEKRKSETVESSSIEDQKISKDTKISLSHSDKLRSRSDKKKTLNESIAQSNTSVNTVDQSQAKADNKLRTLPSDNSDAKKSEKDSEEREKSNDTSDNDCLGGNNDRNTEINELNEDSNPVAGKQESSNKECPSSTEVIVARQSTNSVAKKRIIKVDKRRSEGQHLEKPVVDKIIKEENVEDGGERRRSRRMPFKKDDPLKHLVVPKEEPDDQPKGRDFDLLQIRSELKGIEKAVKVPIENADKFDVGHTFEAKDGANTSKEINDVKVKLEEVSPAREVDLADDIYEFKEPEPFEFEVRQKCSEEKGIKLQRRTFGRMCDDLNKGLSSVKKKIMRPNIKVPPLVTDDKKKFRKNFTKKKEETVNENKLEIPTKKTSSVARDVSGSVSQTPIEPVVVEPVPAVIIPVVKFGANTSQDLLMANSFSKTLNPVEELQEKSQSKIEKSSTLIASHDISKPDNVKEVMDVSERSESMDDDSEDRLVISESEDAELETEKEVDLSVEKENNKIRESTISPQPPPIVLTIPPIISLVKSELLLSEISETSSKPPVTSKEQPNLVKQTNNETVDSIPVNKKSEIETPIGKESNILQENNESNIEECEDVDQEEEEEEEMGDDAISAAIQRVIQQDMTDDESNDVDSIPPPVVTAKPLISHLPTSSTSTHCPSPTFQSQPLHSQPQIQNQPSLSVQPPSLTDSLPSPVIPISQTRSNFGQILSRREGGSRRRKTTLSKEFIEDSDSSDSDNDSKKSEGLSETKSYASKDVTNKREEERLVIIKSSGVSSIIIKPEPRDISSSSMVSYPAAKSLPGFRNRDTPAIISTIMSNKSSVVMPTKHEFSRSDDTGSFSTKAENVRLQDNQVITIKIENDKHDESTSNKIQDQNKFVNPFTGASSSVSSESTQVQKELRTETVDEEKGDSKDEHKEKVAVEILENFKRGDDKMVKEVTTPSEELVKTEPSDIESIKGDDNTEIVVKSEVVPIFHEREHEPEKVITVEKRGVSSETVLTDVVDKMEVDSSSSDKSDAEEDTEEDTHKTDVKVEDECVQSLLCEETIPGSPAPPVFNQKDDKEAEEMDNDNVANSITSTELPFASAPGTSLHTGTPAYTKPVTTQQPMQPIPIQPPPEAAPVMDNTPPTTPESSLSPISNSPRGERSGSSPGLDNDSSKSHRESSEIDLDVFPDHNKMGNYSEEDSVGVPGQTLLKKQPMANPRMETNSSPCKKRRRSRKRSEDAAKRAKLSRRSPRNPAGSDSDDTSENSLAGSTLDLASSRSPKPSKYNFYIQLDPDLDSGQRIAILQQKLQDLRKTYMSLKSELAGIDRRRKKLRRREKEEKTMKQEVSCS